MNGQAGKGDRYRPVDGEKWRRNYERIFGKRKRMPEQTKTSDAGDKAEIRPDDNAERGRPECDAREFVLQVAVLDPLGNGRRWAMTAEGMGVHGVA